MALYHFVRRFFFLLLLLILTGNFVVYRLMHENSGFLKNSHAPLGIISLEIATSQKKIYDITQAWQQTPVTIYGPSAGPEHFTPYTALGVARRQTKLDYFFLLFYSLLLALLLVRLAPERGREKWILAAVVFSMITGLLDAVENVFMLKAMDDEAVEPWTIWLPSGAKWLLLFLLVATILFRLGKTIIQALANKRQPLLRRTREQPTKA